MSSPKIKDRSKQEFLKKIRKTYQKICRNLWSLHFGEKFTGPNQEAQCEDCSYFKSGECLGGEIPEMCIEKSAEYLLAVRFEENH